MQKRFVALFGLILFVLTSKSLCSAGELLQRTNFEDGVSLPWFVSEAERKHSRSEVVDGNYVVHIDYPGSDKWDVSFSHNGFQILKGHTYHVNFSVRSTKSCKIYAKIGDFGTSNREVWNNNSNSFSLKSDEILQVSTEFIAEYDCPIAEFTFGLGGELAASAPYDIEFISISLMDEEFVTTPKPTPTPKYGIRVNQLGYYPKGDKIAILRADRESENNPVDWELKNSSGQTVYKGTASEFGRDAGSREYCNTIDFSGFKTPGKGYSLYCGDEFSLPFDIGTDMYSEMKYDALKYFYYARSGTEIEMPYCEENQWSRPAGHPEDTVQISKHGYKGPPTIDATGGWYSRGDNDKYMINGGLSVWTLQNQYEFAAKKGYSKDFDDKTLNIPESGNKMPDILDEARWEMEWMLNMQIPEGNDSAGMAVHNVISIDFSISSLIPNDPSRRISYAPTTTATLNLAACAAQAARLWKHLDKNFSEKCLLAAETAWAAAKKNPNILCEDSFDDVKDNNIDDEFYWAACELYLTTKKAVYLEDMKSSKYYCKTPYTQNSEKGDVFISPGHSTKATLGTLSLALLAKDEFPQAVEEIIKTADNFVRIRDREGYRVTLYPLDNITEYGGIKDSVIGYPPFSNQTILENAILMAYAYDLKKDTTYLSALRDSLDYIVGRNPILKCYVTGYGANPAKYPYHMYFSNVFKPTSPTVPKGFVVSGPNSHSDLWGSSGMPLSEKIAPQKFYTDSTDSWLTNSVSVDLNAALAWVTAYSDAIGDVEYAPVEDINKDGVVNMADVMMIAKVFNLTKYDSLFDKKCDLNNDGVINMADVMKIAISFGSAYGN